MVEMGLTLLAKAFRPIKYCDEAFGTSIYLINRLPTPIIKDLTHIEALFKVYPRSDTLITFGCLCHLNIRVFNKHKLQRQSIECTFIGYSLNQKGYKCLDSNGRVVIP